MLMVMNDFIGFLLSAIIGRCKNSIHFFFFYHCDLLLTSSWNWLLSTQRRSSLYT